RECSFGGFRSRVIAREPVAGPRVERPSADRSARVAHQTNEEMYIVQGEQAKAEDLVGGEEMPDVRARESRARRAVALVIQRLRIGAVLGAFDVETPIARECSAVATHSSGRDAIEQIHAAAHAFDEVFGKADAHEIAWAVARELTVQDLEDAVHVGLGFAY